MMHTNLRQITFHVEKLKSIVGVGNSTAYQIYTIPGESLGRMGTVIDSASTVSSNEQKFELEPAASEQKDHSDSWLNRALSGMGFRS